MALFGLFGRKEKTDFAAINNTLAKTKVTLKTQEEKTLDVIKKHAENITKGKTDGYDPIIIIQSMTMVTKKLKEINRDTKTLEENKRLYLNNQQETTYLNNFILELNETIRNIEQKTA